MEILIQVGQLILSLSILIILHELGHFTFARLFKTRVEKFYLFFDPWFSLFKVKKGETEYGIGWLPLGGYVKISGMIDESMDKEQLKQPAQPYEFRSKKAWQRLLIMLGGVMVNLLLGFIIYSGIMWVWGEKYLPTKNMTDGVWVVDTIMHQTGIRTGDKILTINGHHPERYGDILEEMLYGGEMIVERNNEKVALQIPENFSGQLVDNRVHNTTIPFYARIPFIISELPDTSINAKSGLKVKDKIVGIGGHPIKYFDEFEPMADTLAGKTLTFTIERDSKHIDIPLTISAEGKIEVRTGYLTFTELEKLGYLKLESQHYSFLQAIPAGFHLAKEKLSKYIRQFKLIFNFKTGAYRGIGGFGAITGLFPPVWDWQSFWEITAFLSLMLAFLNILPIPALDGGHVTFLLFEMITGRKPGDKFLEYAQMVGMFLLLFLLLYANGNDVYRWILRLMGQ